MSYKNLEIWKIARKLVIDIHAMTLEELPKFEMYEEGSQIRRSSKSVLVNIVEGYGRRVYPAEYVRFLTFAIASNDETLEHLEILYETKSLRNDTLHKEIHEQIDTLGRKLNLFIQAIKKRMEESSKKGTFAKEPISEYGSADEP